MLSNQEKHVHALTPLQSPSHSLLCRDELQLTSSKHRHLAIHHLPHVLHDDPELCFAGMMLRTFSGWLTLLYSIIKLL